MGQGFRRLRRRVLGMAVEQLETRALLSDLLGTYFAAPAAAAPGSTFDVTYQVDNNGAPDTPSFHVKFFLSANPSIGGADMELGTGVDLTIPANDNTTHRTQSVTLPAANDPFWGTVSGASYFIGMQIDTGNVVSESEENNNANRGDGLDRASVAVPPDIFGDFFDAAPASALPGAQFNVNYQLHNGGTGPTAQFHTDFYLSNDPTINTADFKLGNGVDTTLGAAATTGHVPYSVTLPDRNDPFWKSVSTGTFYIGMISDTGTAVGEWDEANNSNRGLAQDKDSITLPSIDLVGDFFDVPGAVLPGSTFTATYQISNSGAGLPADFHVSFYRSSNSTITDTDTLIGGADIINLGANANTGHLTVSLTLPDQVTGNFWIGMIIDSGKVVTETNVTNNAEANNASVGDGKDRDTIAIDNTAPTAALTPVTPPTSGTTAFFIVTYSDNVKIKASTIGANDILVTGPNGYSELATAVPLPSQDGNPLTVTYSIPAPDGVWDSFDNGTYTISVAAGAVTDTAGTAVAAGSLGTFNVNISANPPTIGSLTPSPNPVIRPSPLTLTANSVTKGGATSIDKVEFYRDLNGNSRLDVGVDSLLGSDTDGSNGWSLAPSTLGFALGNNANTFFARAQNSDGFWSNVVIATATASNKHPTIGTLTASPSPVTRGTDLTLTANNVVDDDGSVTEVKFYRDSNGNATFDPGTDTLLGSDTNSAGGWTLTTPSVSLDLANPNRFFAVATDNDGDTGNTVQTTLTAVNAAPTIGSLTANPDPVLRSGSVTLTANNVADVDGNIVKVEFYRDVNGNGTLEIGTDVLIGTDTTATDGAYSVSGSAAQFPVGAITYLARAVDNLNGTTVSSVAGTVEPLSVSPAAVSRGQNITLTANGLTNATTKKVEFYRDVNNNSILDEGDVLLGSDSDAAGGWTLTPSTTGFATGVNRYLSRALDTNDVWGTTATITGTVNNVAPTIGSVTSPSPNPLTRGPDITLNANDVNDTDGTITKVEFYRDSNNNGVLDLSGPNADAVLDPDTTSVDGWSLTLSSKTLPVGTNRFFARAIDNDGGASNVVSMTIVANKANPVIGSLSATPTTPVVRGTAITLTANNVTDADGTIAKVEFYRDMNNNSTLEVGTDLLLGSDTTGEEGVFTWTNASNAFKVGSNTFLARAIDNDGGVSGFKTTTITASNAAPTIESLSASPDPVLRSQNLTLTANNVTDVDGTITKVEFYRDSNGNGTLEVGTDLLLGTDTSSAGGWTFTGSAATLPFGANTYLARAIDNDLAPSVEKTTEGKVEPLSITPDTVVRGSAAANNFTLIAQGLTGTITKVDFYRDSNNDGVLDKAVDTKLGFDDSATGGWSFTTTSTASFSAGTNKFFAVVDDSATAWGAITGTVTNNAPTIASMTTNKTTIVRGDAVTLTAKTVADGDGTIASVQFYRDSNGNNVFDLGVDTLLGTGVADGSDYTFAVPTAASSALTKGTNRFFARATDSDSSVSNVVTVTLDATNKAPTIESLSHVPDPITRGQSITLTANNVLDTDGSIAKVEFYRDINDNGLIDDGANALLATDTSSTGGWTFNGSSVSFPVGPAIKFLARATDNDGTVSNIVITTVEIDNAIPTIVSLSASPTPIERGKSLTLTANNVNDADGPISQVEFYLDRDGDGQLDLTGDAQDDLLLSPTDTISADGWKWTGSTASFALGVIHFLARAKDSSGDYSNLVATVATINDAAPVVASLTVTPNPALPGQDLTLTANGVSDDDKVIKVQFYRDTNNNGQLDLDGANPDDFLGEDPDGIDGWTFAYASAGLANGNYRFFARAQDTKNAFSNMVSFVTTIGNPCPVSGVIFNDLNGNGRKNKGEGPVAGWRVYIDENNNKKRDTGEINVKTDSRGRWKLNPAHFGTNRIRYERPTGWKATTASTLTLNFNSASCFPSQLFGVKRIV